MQTSADIDCKYDTIVSHLHFHLHLHSTVTVAELRGLVRMPGAAATPGARSLGYGAGTTNVCGSLPGVCATAAVYASVEVGTSR